MKWMEGVPTRVNETVEETHTLLVWSLHGGVYTNSDTVVKLVCVTQLFTYYWVGGESSMNMGEMLVVMVWMKY